MASVCTCLVCSGGVRLWRFIRETSVPYSPAFESHLTTTLISPTANNATLSMSSPSHAHTTHTYNPPLLDYRQAVQRQGAARAGLVELGRGSKAKDRRQARNSTLAALERQSTTPVHASRLTSLFTSFSKSSCRSSQKQEKGETESHVMYVFPRPAPVRHAPPLLPLRSPFPFPPLTPLYPLPKPQ